MTALRSIAVWVAARAVHPCGRATGLLILGGNIFGILAPIVTGYVVQATGNYD